MGLDHRNPETSGWRSYELLNGDCITDEIDRPSTRLDLCFDRMTQFAVRLLRKLNKRGERTDARISLKIQMDSACACRVVEMTMKLVNRIMLVTAHMMRATNMRMIICFMIPLLSSCDLPKARTAP
jgi:hypothetical protein